MFSSHEYYNRVRYGTTDALGFLDDSDVLYALVVCGDRVPYLLPYPPPPPQPHTMLDLLLCIEVTALE